MGWLSRLLFGGKESKQPRGRNYTIGIVGESKKNRDGSSRQAAIKRCHEGEHITLIPEPDNPFDPLAIMAVCPRGTCLGYISRDHNEWIGKKIEKDLIASSTIHAIIGGTKGQKSVGVLLSIEMR